MLLKLVASTVAVAATIVVAAGCGGEPAAPCQVGDPTLEPELQIVVPRGGLVELADGDVLTMTQPPQGGMIALVGLRVRNVDTCGATVQAALIDPCDQHVLGVERRPVTFRLADDGFAEPAQPDELSDFANLATCPNSVGSRDVDGQPYDLEVRLYEASGRTTTRRISVTPTCGDDEWCRCQCDADYVNGGDCNVDPDGGVIGCGDGVDAGVDAAP